MTRDEHDRQQHDMLARRGSKAEAMLSTAAAIETATVMT